MIEMNGDFITHLRYLIPLGMVCDTMKTTANDDVRPDNGDVGRVEAQLVARLGADAGDAYEQSIFTASKIHQGYRAFYLSRSR